MHLQPQDKTHDKDHGFPLSHNYCHMGLSNNQEDFIPLTAVFYNCSKEEGIFVLIMDEADFSCYLFHESTTKGKKKGHEVRIIMSVKFLAKVKNCLVISTTLVTMVVV